MNLERELKVHNLLGLLSKTKNTTKRVVFLALYGHVLYNLNTRNSILLKTH